MEDAFIMSRLVGLDVKWTGLHRAGSKFNHSGHSNPYYELIMVIDGPVYLQVEEERLVLHSGECLLLTPWQQHKGWRTAETGTSFYWVQFTASPAPIHPEAAGSLNRSLQLFRRHHHDLRTAEGADEELLRRNPEATIETVAREVGFQDPFYFSKVFKQIVGTSPSQFRKTGEGGQGAELMK